MFVGIKVNENWRKRNDKELMQLFEDLGILSFVRIIWLNWIGHVSRMDSKRKVSQVFNSYPQGSRLRGRQQNRWWNYVPTDVINVKLQIGKRSQKT